MIDEMEAMLLGPSLRAINRKMQPYLHYLIPRLEVGEQQQPQGRGQEGQQGGGPGAGEGGGYGPGSSSKGAAAGRQLLGIDREELQMMMLGVLQEVLQQQQLQVVRNFMGDERCVSGLSSVYSGLSGSDGGGIGRIKNSSKGEGGSSTETGRQTETKKTTQLYIECSEEVAGATHSGSEEEGVGKAQGERLEEGQEGEDADVDAVKDQAAV